MGLNYGSNFKPSYLPQGEVGTTQIIDNSLPWWYSFTQVMLNIAQFGLAFVPGVGEIADLAIAGVQTGIEKAVTGKIDPMTAGLNFGMSGIGAIKSGASVVKSYQTAQSAQPILKQIVKDLGEDIPAQITRGQHLGQAFGTSLGVQEAADGFISHPQIYSGLKQQIKIGEKVEWIAGRDPLTQSFMDVGNNIVAKRIQQMQSVKAEAESLLKQKFISPERLDNFIKNTTKSNYAGASTSTLSKIISRGNIAGRGASEGYQTERRVVESLKKSLSFTDYEIYQLRKLINEFGQITNKRMFYAILRKSFARTNNELIGAALKGGTQKLIKQLIRKETTAAKLARVSGQAAKKTTKAMKIATNPGYVVRKFIKDTVGKIEEEAIDIAKKKAIAMLAKGGKQAAKLEEMFAKSGGIMMDSSVIMGYKLIADELEWKTMLIKFRPDATSSKSGRNKGGKVDVIVNCNEQDFIAFTKASSKMGFYLDNWARSRGGRYPNATSLDAMGISNEMVDILGFLPIKQIRPYLALSTMVKNVATSKSIPFIWKSEYFDKISEDFVSEALKETAGNATHLLPHHISKYAKRAVDSAMDGNGITKISTSMIAAQAKKAERRHRTKQVKKIGTVSKIGVRSVKLFR